MTHNSGTHVKLVILCWHVIISHSHEFAAGLVDGNILWFQLSVQWFKFTLSTTQYSSIMYYRLCSAYSPFFPLSPVFHYLQRFFFVEYLLVGITWHIVVDVGFCSQCQLFKSHHIFPWHGSSSLCRLYNAPSTKWATNYPSINKFKNLFLIAIF